MSLPAAICWTPRSGITSFGSIHLAIGGLLTVILPLDYVSYSSYDAMNLDTPGLYATLDYIESKIPTAKAASIPGQRLWIGEYGWGAQSPGQQEPLTRAYIQRLLNYGHKDLPFILFWEIYNNETNRSFCLVDPANHKTPCYNLHQRFINLARLLTARFKESHGRLPTDAEFASFMSPLLNQPLPAPVHLEFSNQRVLRSSETNAALSATFAQGVYGDDDAGVWAFWGLADGGTNRSAWQHSLFLEMNTNFNPTAFTVSVTNLLPQTNYFFRFYATNSSAQAWAPFSAALSTRPLDTSGGGGPGRGRGPALCRWRGLHGCAGHSHRFFNVRSADGWRICRRLQERKSMGATDGPPALGLEANAGSGPPASGSPIRGGSVLTFSAVMGGEEAWTEKSCTRAIHRTGSPRSARPTDQFNVPPGTFFCQARTGLTAQGTDPNGA
jgi:hypothetical protein